MDFRLSGTGSAIVYTSLYGSYSINMYNTKEIPLWLNLCSKTWKPAKSWTQMLWQNSSVVMAIAVKGDSSTIAGTTGIIIITVIMAVNNGRNTGSIVAVTTTSIITIGNRDLPASLI
jgi:hypothetical protein